jgi:hypothetical protein
MVPDGDRGYEYVGGLNILRVYIGAYDYRGKPRHNHRLLKERPNPRMADALLKKYGEDIVLHHNAKQRLRELRRAEIRRAARRTINRFIRNYCL